MGGGKLYIEIGLVVVVGMMWLSMPITPSLALAPASAPGPSDALPCWDKIVRCVNSTFNETNLSDLIDPAFNASHVLCCSVFQQQAKADKHCFCRGAILISEFDDSHASSMDQLLSFCYITSPVNALCSGASGRQIGWAMLLSLLFIVCTTFTF